METSLLCHQSRPSLRHAEWHSLIRDLARMEATFRRLFEFESISDEHSHTQARALIVGWLSEAWSQLRKVMTLTGAASHCDLDKQRWSVVYLWLEVQSARVGDPLDYLEQTCPLMATWYNVMSPSAMWTQHAESWPGFISPGDGLFWIVYHELVLFSQLMTAAANIKLTHAERDFRLFARGFKRKKSETSGKKEEEYPFLWNFKWVFPNRLLQFKFNQNKVQVRWLHAFQK